MEKSQLGRLGLDEHRGKGGPEATHGGGQFHQPSRASRLRIARARASTVFAVGQVSSSATPSPVPLASSCSRSSGQCWRRWGAISKVLPP